MAYGQVNADVIGTSVSGSNLGAGNASICKNRLINGDMRIDQRNAGASVTPTAGGYYTVDRFWVQLTQASKFSIQQQTSVAPVGFTNSVKITSLAATSLAAGDYYTLQQSIEGFNIADLGWGTANAKTVTLSFQVYSSLTGTFGGSLTNSAFNRAYPFTYTVSSANTWTTVSVTIAGDTSGTWLATNGIGIQVIFGLGVGTTYSGTAGSWGGTGYLSATGATSVVGTNGATFYITGVQLEVGSSATGYEYRQYQQELALCQRYCFALGTAGGNLSMDAIGANSGTTTTRMLFTYPTTMRSAPTATFSAANTFLVQQIQPFTNFTPSAVSSGALNTQSMHIDFTISGGTAGASCLLFDNTSSAKITVSAEL